MWPGEEVGQLLQRLTKATQIIALLSLLQGLFSAILQFQHCNKVKLSERLRLRDNTKIKLDIGEEGKSYFSLYILCIAVWAEHNLNVNQA